MIPVWRSTLSTFFGGAAIASRAPQSSAARPTPRMCACLNWVMETQGPEYPVHEAILIQVELALTIESPAYTFGYKS